MNAPLKRTVEGNILTSRSMPPLRIKVADVFTYAGNLQFTLYNVAQVDLYLFVVADEHNRVKRRLLVQFEGYSPDNAYTYNFTGSQTITIGDHEYIYDRRAIDLSPYLRERPDSDAARGDAFLQQQGYQVGEEVLIERFMRTVDEARRNELLFIYLEDLRDMGYSAADFEANGRAASHWDRIADGLHQRALESFTVSET